MAGTTITLFNYGAMDRALARQLRSAAKRIHTHQRQAVESVVAVGRDLIAVKSALPHGRFGAWIAAEFGMSMRTAQTYMNVATHMGDRCETISHLPLSTVYSLAAPSTPNAARDDILQRLSGPEVLEPSVIAAAIADARRESGRAREEARIAALPDDERERLAFESRVLQRAYTVKRHRDAEDDYPHRSDARRLECTLEAAALLRDTLTAVQFERLQRLLQQADMQRLPKALGAFLEPDPISQLRWLPQKAATDDGSHARFLGRNSAEASVTD